MSKRTHVPRRPCFRWVSLLLHFTCLQAFFLQCDVWLQARNGLLQAFCNFEGNMITKNLSASEMFIGRMYNGVQIVYYNVCPFSRAWRVYFWLFNNRFWRSWDKLVVGGNSLVVLVVFQADLVVFGAKIWRSRWVVGGFQIRYGGFWGRKFWSLPGGLGALDGHNWTTGRDSSISDVLRIWSRGFLGSNFEHRSQWVLGVMMDNWAWFVYSPPPQEMTADQLSGAAGYVDLMIQVWRSFSCICTRDASVFVFAM